MEERQVKHFKFRQMRRISTGTRLSSGTTGKYSLLCCANTYGMLYIGGNNSFAVCHTAMLYDVNDEDTHDRNEAVSLEKLKPVMVSLPGQPCHLGLSADELTLSVCLKESSLSCLLYDTRAFCEPRSQSPRPFVIINLADASGGVQVCGLSWNPVQPESFAVCLSNGSVSVWENQGTSVKCSTTLACEAASICWSPKGKQLAVGHKDGRVSQFSPQMDLKKDYPAPQNLAEKHEVTGLFWISTHQFALVLTPSNPPAGEDDGLPPPSHFMILTVSKKKAPEFEDFDDIYYGMGNNEPHFLFAFLSVWNILITSSSSASESMVLSKQPGSEVAWEKWNLEDEGRAELPVFGTDDTFPCGMCLDLTSTVPIPYGENNEIPPSPLFVLLSDRGLLAPYMVFNVEPPPGTSYDFVKPPQALSKTGERLAPSQSSALTPTPMVTQVSQPKVLNTSTTAIATTVATTATNTSTPLVNKALLNETFAPSSTFARSFSLDKKPLSFSLPPFSAGGSLPNLLTAGNPPLPALSKPQSIVTTLSQGIPKAPFSSSNAPFPPSTTATTTVAAAAVTKTPPTTFKQPLLSSTPISTVSQKVVGTSVPSATMTTMPPPSMPPPRMMAAASTVTPVALQKVVASHAPPTRASAPSPTLSVTSSVEEENVEKGLMASIEQEIEEFSEQLQDHFDDIQEVFCSDLDFPDDCSCAIGSEEDRGNLVKGQEEMSTTVNSLLDETKDLTNMVEGMMDEVLECRSLYEEANDAIRMRNSDHYREYVRKKPLTPLLQNLLDEVHAQYTIAEARVRELSAQIDADVERRKELEAIRVGGARPPLHTPTYHNIYTTLKNNRRITRLQSTSIDHLVEKMKNMTVIPRAWNFSSPAPTASLSSSIHDKPTRQSQALLNEVKGVVTPGKQTKKKKQPLFKYSPERLSQLQELFESSVQSTSMQTIPVVTSFTHKSPTHSSRSTTPVIDDDEDSEIEPHTPPTFSENQPGKLHQRQGNSSVNQPLQGAPFVSQVSRLLQSTESDPLPQEIPQLPGLHHPLSNPPYGLPPLNQVPPDLSQGGSTLQSKAGPTGQPFPSQVYVTSVPPPPPPSQPPSQDHVIHHGGTSSTVTTKGPTMTAKTPSEMAAEAALKRQQSACGATTVTAQNVVVTTAVTKTPVVVITASEMPPSSLFFTGKPQTKPPVTESTTGVHVFGTPLLDHSTSIPANFQFNFAQNPILKMPPFFASTTGSQTSLAYGLSTSNNDKFSSMSSLLSKSETSFPKPATGTAPPQAGNLLSKSESSLFRTGVTTSGNKPSSLVYSFNASEPSITDSLTKPFSGQKESEVTSEEETEQSEDEQDEDEQDETLTKSPADNDSTAATPILSLNTKPVLSGSMPTLATPVTATPAVAATTIKSSVTFSAPSTLSINKPTLISTKAPPTSVATTAPPPTLPTATTAPPTSSVISSTTTLSSVVVSTAPPTLIADSLPMTSTAPPTLIADSLPMISTAPPTLIADSLPMTSTAPPTFIADSLPMTSTAPPTFIADSLPLTSVTKSTTSEISSTTSTSGASPVTESAAPPISETTGAPPIAESTAPPITTSATTPTSTTAIAAPATTTATITSAVTINPISVVPPTPSTTAPPAILSITTTEATSVSNPPTLAVPLFRVADKPSDSEGESDVIDNGLDRVASQSSLNSNMSDDINIVDDSEGEMDKEPAQSKETSLNQGFTSLFGEKKMATNSTSNPFGSLGNVSDNSSGVHSAHTPSVGSSSQLLAPSKFQSGFGQSSGLGIGMQAGWGLGQTGMGAGQTGMGVGQTGMGVGQTGMGVGQTGMGVGQTGMGVGQTGMGLGMGAGNSASALGAKFGSSPLVAAQAQFGRPAMGSSMMGSTANTRVFGSSMDSDGATSFSSLASGGHGGQTFGGIGIGTGMGGVNKSSFQAWR